MNTSPDTRSVSYPLTEEGLHASGLPAFVQDKIRTLAAAYRIERLLVEESTAQGERATLWSETLPALWFHLGGSCTWANIDGAYTTFDPIPEELRPQTPALNEVWWLRVAGEDEPYVLEVFLLTLRWGEVKGVH